MRMEKLFLAHRKSDAGDGDSNKKQGRGFSAACLECVEMLIRKAGEINSVVR